MPVKKVRKGKRAVDQLTSKQWLFVDRFREWVARGKRPVYREIALEIGVAENRPSKWMRLSKFRDALNQVFTDAHPIVLKQAAHSVGQAATSGNLAAFDRLMDYHARFVDRTADTDGQAPGGANNGTVIHIHQIPARQPMSALPPTLTLPAQSGLGASTSAPAK